MQLLNINTLELHHLIWGIPMNCFGGFSFFGKVENVFHKSNFYNTNLDQTLQYVSVFMHIDR